jgi:hypothetical protein
MRNPEKGKPQSTEALAGEVERGFDESGKLPDRLIRYAAARQRALINLSQVDKKIKSWYEEHSYEDVSTSTGWHSSDPFIRHLENLRPKLANCGNYLGFRHYYTVGKVRLTAATFCKAHLLCPLCAIRRGSKTLEAYTTRYNFIMAENQGLKLAMLTLTVKNGDDLAERFEHLRSSFQRLLERRRDYQKKGRGFTEFSKVLGLVGAYEVTNKGNGWHPHAHMMILYRQRINAAALKREWQAITGDSHVLRIDPARHPKDPAQDFLEVFKYALKFSDLTPEQNMEAYEIMRGKRLLFSAGLFWGVEVPESMLDEKLDDLPYIDLLYKYFVGSGYNLSETRDSEVFKAGRPIPVDKEAIRQFKAFKPGWNNKRIHHNSD